LDLIEQRNSQIRVRLVRWRNQLNLSANVRWRG
jgi:hypothetical protein